MELEKQTFWDAWEAATPLLQRDTVLRDLTNEWGVTLLEIRAKLEQTLESVTTVEALFEQLNHTPEVAVIPYAAMLVLRTLIDPITQPVTALAGDLTITIESAKVIYGNATLSGSVHNNGALVVFGDLTIENIYDDAAWSYSLLAVSGTVHARGVMSFGDMLVRGDLLVSDVVHAWYNDYTLAVGGVLRTKVLIEEYHSTWHTTLDAQERAHLYRDVDRLRTLFVDDVFSETERNGELEVELDTGLLFDRLERGQPVYR